MQRIDENTFIDDTLVTCAEYQLFIDEMREQGKYYQPDHWTSYQFPEGKAREPILGVRQSDAVAFCEWLTKRGTREWQYRLPIQKEADTFHIKFAGKSPLGYWIGADYQLAWVRDIPKGARGHHRFMQMLNDRLAHALDIALIRTQANIPDRVISRSVNRPLYLDCVSDPYLVNVFSLTNVLNRDLFLSFGHSHDEGFRIVLYVMNRIDINQSLYFALDKAKDRNLDIDHILEIYIDIFTLQQRIVGRSPAFEGIRLVKERIR